MEVTKIDGLRIYILESLRSGDKKTGEDLKDNLRQIWYEQKITDFDCQYYKIFNSNDLEIQLVKIEKEILKENKIPIIQFECHGSESGIQLASSELINWKDLFYH